MRPKLTGNFSTIYRISTDSIQIEEGDDHDGVDISLLFPHRFCQLTGLYLPDDR